MKIGKLFNNSISTNGPSFHLKTGGIPHVYQISGYLGEMKCLLNFVRKRKHNLVWTFCLMSKGGTVLLHTDVQFLHTPIKSREIFWQPQAIICWRKNCFPNDVHTASFRINFFNGLNGCHTSSQTFQLKAIKSRTNCALLAPAVMLRLLPASCWRQKPTNFSYLKCSDHHFSEWDMGPVHRSGYHTTWKNGFMCFDSRSHVIIQNSAYVFTSMLFPASSFVLKNSV